MGKIFGRLYLVLLCLLLIGFSACQEGTTRPEGSGGFAIYIVDENSYQEISLDKLKLSQQPFLSTSDITSYKWDDHHITYPETVYERLKTWGNLLHRFFVVTVGSERIYWGRFMDDLDSGGCQNPVIRLIPRHPDGRNTMPPSIMIDRAYPEYFGTDPDPRADNRIHKAFEKAGILIP